MHLSACNNNNSPHKLEFQILRAGGWPETKLWLGVASIHDQIRSKWLMLFDIWNYSEDGGVPAIKLFMHAHYTNRQSL